MYDGNPPRKETERHEINSVTSGDCGQKARHRRRTAERTQVAKMTNSTSLKGHEPADRGEGERQPRDVHCSEEKGDCQFDGTKVALASTRDLEAEELPAIHETTFLNGESVRIYGGRRAADYGLGQSACCGSRQAFVVVSIRTVTYKLAMRWCAYSMRKLMEMTASFDEISAVRLIRSD